MMLRDEMCSRVQRLVTSAGVLLILLTLPVGSRAGEITPTVNTPFEFAATGRGIINVLTDTAWVDIAEFLGPNWRFTLRFYSHGSPIGIDPFIFEHTSFRESEGVTFHQNAAGANIYEPPLIFNWGFGLSPSGGTGFHPLSDHFDIVSVNGEIHWDSGLNAWSWSATFRATHNCPGACQHDMSGPITANVVALPNPAAINTGITLTANVNDTATGGSNIAAAEYNIDGGPFAAMAASDSAFNSASENVTASIAPFTTAAVHTLCVRGRDAVGNTGGSACILLAVYDPNGGFTTGGGSVESPAGADLVNTSAAGPATFGFVSKYLPGRSTPDGSLEFQFHEGNLNFKSTRMDWLVVTGEPRSIFQGTGTINGANDCRFEVDAWDGSFQPGNLDAFGLKIFSCASGGDRYSLPARPLTKGSIIIHKE